MSSYATARVKNCTYSVPAQLINAHLLARVSETTVSFHHAGVEVARYPRALTQQAASTTARSALRSCVN